MTITLSTIEAKEEFSELINRVLHHGERFILTRRGKEVAAVISIQALQALELQENQVDLSEAITALQESREQGFISFESLKEKLG